VHGGLLQEQRRRRAAQELVDPQRQARGPLVELRLAQPQEFGVELVLGKRGLQAPHLRVHALLERAQHVEAKRPRAARALAPQQGDVVGGVLLAMDVLGFLHVGARVGRHRQVRTKSLVHNRLNQYNPPCYLFIDSGIR